MPWSYTALTAFETCPRRYYHTRVKKDFPDPPGEEAQWGQRVHKALEVRLKTNEPITGAMAMFDPFAAKVAKLPGERHVELKVALTEDLQPTTFFAKDVWCRGVLDVAVRKDDTLAIFDWKTGKRKPDSDQLKLFAGIGFAVFSGVERIATAFVWLKDKVFDKAVYSIADQSQIWRGFLPRVHRMEQAHKQGTFPPNPSGLCRKWCPVKTCEFYKK